MLSDEGEHGQDVVGFALRTDIRGDKFDPRIPEYFLEGQYKHMKHNGLTEQKHELIRVFYSLQKQSLVSIY